MWYCLKCSGRISLPQKYEIKNVCNLRVLDESEIEERGGPWQSREKPTAAGLVSQQRNLNILQRVTLNVIQVFQRIFDAINPCIIIYEYINTFFLFVSVLLPFIFNVVYGEVMIVFEKCRKQKIFLLLLDKLLGNAPLGVFLTYLHTEIMYQQTLVNV